MKILVLNCGSSSLKYQLIDMSGEVMLAKGLVERIGKEDARLKHQVHGGKKLVEEHAILNHSSAIKEVMTKLTDPEKGVIKDFKEISAVGHRVVHGGERFSQSSMIDSEVMEVLKECSKLAPLHNPHNIKGIEAAMELFPGVLQVAVFDTAFHQTIPEHAYLYPLPYDFYDDYKIRRYGFHGTSHFYVSRRAAELMDKPVQDLNIITAHLGNGCSITAIKGGKSIDTSMGFTPLEGLVMGTRCGDIDPFIPLYLIEMHHSDPEEIDRVLNKKSGLLGLSQVSNDSREIEEGYEAGEPGPCRAFEVMAYRLKKYISSYFGVLGSVDALVFTAGIGENSPHTRRASCQGLDNFGIKLDPEKNESTIRGVEADISHPDSEVKVFVIPTNEELVIARDTLSIYNETN